MPRSARRRPLPLDVYLMPSILGSGRGDVEEVLSAGDRLQQAGARVQLYVVRNHNKPWLSDPTFGWDRWPHTRRLARRRPRALTLSSHFGVTASDPRNEPLGGPGPWTAERQAIDASYGPRRTLHVSFEEFARTLTSRQQAEERHREGGRSSRDRRRRRAEIAGEAPVAHELYRRFRDLNRPNLLAVFPTFSPSGPFAREFPETVQCGPLWPASSPRRRPRRRRTGVVVWYASPSTSERLAPAIRSGMTRARAGRLEIRSPRPFDVPGLSPPVVAFLPAESRRGWAERWGSADLRIATGSRSLLEALQTGGPFLYFNGMLGTGPAARRHRPEKLDALLRVWRNQGVAPSLRQDLRDFARGRRGVEIVARALGHPAWRLDFPKRMSSEGFPPGFADAGDLLTRVARRFADGPDPSGALVRSLQRQSRISKA